MWDRDCQRLRHLGTGEVTRTEVKLCHSVASQSHAFYFVITVSFVFGEYNPRSLCDELKPRFIWRAASEVVSVSLMLDTMGQ